MKKLIKQHEEGQGKKKKEQKQEEGAMPAYLLDR